MRLFIVFISCLLYFQINAQQVIGAFVLGKTSVNVVKHSFGQGGYVFYNMHDNENTGVEAALKVLKKSGGELYELVHSGERYIKFELNGTEFLIDPNRIYTDTGVWRELERSGDRDSTAFEMVRSFGKAVVDLIAVDDQSLIIALHNNTEDNYSSLSYAKGADYETDAEAVYIGKHRDPDEFYFVTTPRLFGMLSPIGYNVVLQNNASVTDDGSLSVYCGHRGIEYVNIEAQHGHRKANKKMLRRMLQELNSQGY